MNILVRRIKHLFTQPKKSLANLIVSTQSLWPDKLYLSILFWCRMGKKIDWASPQTYSEKLQWLKLYNRDPKYTVMVDKAAVKDYVASIIGKEYIIPTLAIWDKTSEIEWDSLPEKFVLKCTHDSGGVVICKDKNNFDRQNAIQKIDKALKSNYYYLHREWPYINVPRRIIAEQYMEDGFGELRDYKWFCFDGEVKALFIATDRSKGDHATRFDFFDENFNHLPFTNGHPNADVQPEKPKMFEEMKALAAKLSKGIPHVRIDFYEVGTKIYFGEMTFFHWSGFMPYDPEEWDYKFGSWLKLPNKI